MPQGKNKKLAILLIGEKNENLILHCGPVPNNYSCCDWKKIFNDDALFEGAICKEHYVYKRFRKCGSCHKVPRNV